jgi:uncharacterized membrane protein
VRRGRASVAILVGVCILAATIFAIVSGIRHPTTTATIVVSLLSVIGVPISLLAISAGVRWWQRPNAETLRTETAERIKAELNAYIALRLVASRSTGDAKSC